MTSKLPGRVALSRRVLLHVETPVIDKRISGEALTRAIEEQVGHVREHVSRAIRRQHRQQRRASFRPCRHRLRECEGCALRAPSSPSALKTAAGDTVHVAHRCRALVEVLREHGRTAGEQRVSSGLSCPRSTRAHEAPAMAHVIEQCAVVGEEAIALPPRARRYWARAMERSLVKRTSARNEEPGGHEPFEPALNEMPVRRARCSPSVMTASSV